MGAPSYVERVIAALEIASRIAIVCRFGIDMYHRAKDNRDDEEGLEPGGVMLDLGDVREHDEYHPERASGGRERYPTTPQPAPKRGYQSTGNRRRFR
ncbi:hypothetical protein [Haloarcula pelagica]|uniref:hypothetical protein n=1 Tax=Haloarcula pelagica TaxID=3033389 RepID=UPI0024C2AC6F|nr:hypothetical protein [Halomicroarcula sp. YJ-61-S]